MAVIRRAAPTEVNISDHFESSVITSPYKDCKCYGGLGREAAYNPCGQLIQTSSHYRPVGFFINNEPVLILVASKHRVTFIKNTQKMHLGKLTACSRPTDLHSTLIYSSNSRRPRDGETEGSLLDRQLPTFLLLPPKLYELLLWHPDMVLMILRAGCCLWCIWLKQSDKTSSYIILNKVKRVLCKADLSTLT